MTTRALTSVGQSLSFRTTDHPQLPWETLWEGRHLDLTGPCWFWAWLPGLCLGTAGCHCACLAWRAAPYLLCDSTAHLDHLLVAVRGHT